MVRANDGTVPTTPIQIQTRRQALLLTNGMEISSPSTPHRIELRNDNNEENLKKTLDYQPPTPKAKRKKIINNNTSLVNNGTSNNNNQNMKIKDSTNNNNNINNNNNNNGKINGQHTLTEYFPVRRSIRKTKTIVLEEQQMKLEKLVKSGIEDGLEVRLFEEKGRGVVATKNFNKGDFVVEYSGEFVDTIEAKRREELYAQNENAGCYMYYFKHNELQYCIDATEETGRLGRLVNHSRTRPNLVTKTVMIDKKPRLVLIAKHNIKKGAEILYDYGDRTKESLQHHPWLSY